MLVVVWLWSVCDDLINGWSRITSIIPFFSYKNKRIEEREDAIEEEYRIERERERKTSQGKIAQFILEYDSWILKKKPTDKKQWITTPQWMGELKRSYFFFKRKIKKWRLMSPSSTTSLCRHFHTFVCWKYRVAICEISVNFWFAV